MAGEVGGGGPGEVTRIESLGRAVTPEDVWNAAIRAGVDPARMALSLCHVLGSTTVEEMDAGLEGEPVAVRYTLTTGEAIEYDAGLHNPFRSLRRTQCGAAVRPERDKVPKVNRKGRECSS